MPKTTRRVLRFMTLFVAFLVVGLGAWFAAKTTLTTSEPQSEAPPTKVISTVTEGTVGKSLNYSVKASLPTAPIFYNSLSGLVTAISESGEFSEGEVLYEVDHLPVRAVTSDIVFYRTMEPGQKGEDIRALQDILKRANYLQAEASGFWGSATTAAVKQWQRELGVTESGLINLGELVPVKALPAVLTLSDSLALGKPVTAGEPSVSAANGELIFSMTVSTEQARSIPNDTTIEIAAPSGTWPAVIVGTEETESGEVQFILEHPKGGAPCKNSCDALASSDTTTLRATQFIVPEVSGPAVPTVAIRTDTAGKPYVIHEDGSKTAVEVLGSANGTSIVSGVNIGDTVIALESQTSSSESEPENDAKDSL